LWLHGGRWKDQPIVPSAWMAAAIQPHAQILRGDYGYGLWVNREHEPILFEANGHVIGRCSPVVPRKSRPLRSGIARATLLAGSAQGSRLLRVGLGVQPPLASP
jgi:hypothetical protein